MAVEIIRLTRVGAEIIEGTHEVVPHEYPSGRIVNLRYLLDEVGIENSSPGRLSIYAKTTKVELYTTNLNSGVDVFDTEIDGSITHYTRYVLGFKNGLNLDVIQTEIWRNDIGVRIRHVPNDV